MALGIGQDQAGAVIHLRLLVKPPAESHPYDPVGSHLPLVDLRLRTPVAVRGTAVRGFHKLQLLPEANGDGLPTGCDAKVGVRRDPIPVDGVSRKDLLAQMAAVLPQEEGNEFLRVGTCQSRVNQEQPLSVVEKAGEHPRGGRCIRADGEKRRRGVVVVP